MNDTFTKHDDPGHGWLEVQESDLKELGATVNDFSRYSYRHGNRLFLEEDCDAGKFFTLYKNKHGVYPSYVTEHHDGDFPEDYKWYSQKWFSYNGIKQPNRNRLLWRIPDVDGIKTGHTNEAGFCLAASGKKNALRLITIVMGAPSDEMRAQDSQKLLTYGFRFFESRKLYHANVNLSTTRIWFGQRPQIKVGLAQDLYATLPLGTSKKSIIFVWRMKSETIQFVTYAFLAGTLLGGMVATMLQKLIEKKNVVLVGFGLLIANWLVLQGLQLAGLYLPLGDDAVLPMQINSFTAGVGIGFVSVVYPSMMADAADEHELLFKNRREGLYFAGLGLANNAGRSIGVMMAGFALDLISFPKGVTPDDVAVLPGSAQSQLVLIWGPLPAIVAIASMVVFARYRITRARHRDISIALGRVI
jgi:hypothetical protein